MSKLVLFSLMVVLIACTSEKPNTSKTGNATTQLSEYQHYLFKEFKNEFFVLCLGYGYGPEDGKFLRNDYSFAHDFPMGVYGSKVIDSLALVQLEAIRTDSLYLISEISPMDSDALGKKRVLQFCLKGYESQTLDSLALIWAQKLAPSE